MLIAAFATGATDREAVAPRSPPRYEGLASTYRFSSQASWNPLRRMHTIARRLRWVPLGSRDDGSLPVRTPGYLVAIRRSVRLSAGDRVRGFDVFVAAIARRLELTVA
jgi:hypothetical protein